MICKCSFKCKKYAGLILALIGIIIILLCVPVWLWLAILGILLVALGFIVQSK